MIEPVILGVDEKNGVGWNSFELMNTLQLLSGQHFMDGLIKLLKLWGLKPIGRVLLR
jgi:hypothetical protein